MSIPDTYTQKRNKILTKSPTSTQIIPLVILNTQRKKVISWIDCELYSADVDCEFGDSGATYDYVDAFVFVFDSGRIKSGGECICDLGC